MAFHFRTANPEDAPALRRLNAAFNGDTGVSDEDIRRSLLISPEVVVIAEEDGSPAGFCCAQVHHSFCYAAPVAEVTEMYVSEAFRRRGCAQGMLQHLTDLLRSRHGVDELHLLTGRRNAAAQAAYRKAGFRERDEAYMTLSLK